jgi:hypothetical protein
MLRIKRVNNEDVKPVQYGEGEKDVDKRPVKGADIFPENFSAIFFCARKKSGKTLTIQHVIKNCATSETRVIAFVSTLHRDKTWRSIEAMCEKMNVKFDGYTSLVDSETKENILDGIVKTLEAEVEKQKAQPAAAAASSRPLILLDTDPSTKEKKKKKPKEQAPKIIFVLDDLSDQLKSPVVTKLIKNHRHFKSKVLLSSQYWNDLDLQARQQINYFLAWRGLGNSVDKLMEIYRNLGLTVPFPLFAVIYSECTKLQYNFMYVDVENSQFRRNFTHKIELPPEDETEDLPDRQA